MLFDRFKASFVKKTKQELDEHYDKIELEKGDFLAMVIAAFITFLPVLLITLFVLFGLIWFVFR
jgi:flagellar biosynthesis/type III secretory pathway M-ring protein FliF/YscJ